MFSQNKYSVIYNYIIARAQSIEIRNEYTEMHHIVPRSLGGSDDAINLVALTAREHFICHRLLTRMVQGRDLYRMQKAALMMASVLIKGERIRVTARLYAKLRSDAAQATRELMRGKVLSEEHRRKISIANTGKVWSEDQRQRLSDSCKGRPSSNRGKAMSEEQKQKIANTLRGRPPSPETVVKIAAANRGKKRTEEQRRNLSNGQKGRVHKPHTEESKRKLSEALKGRPKGTKGKPSPHRGRKHTPEALANMAAGHTNRPTVECEHCGKIVQKPMYARWHGQKCSNLIA